MKLKLILATVAFAALTGAEAASLRRLPSVTVAEGETALLDGLNAVGLASANTAVATVTPPDGNKATLSGVRLGETEITYTDERGPFAVRPVRTVPTYWKMLQKFFEDDPEVTLGVIGDKVVIAGQTANVDTLRRLDEARRMDQQRLVVQVNYSGSALAVLVTDFLSAAGVSNVAVQVIGREVCLAGRMYDRQSIERVTSRVRDFLKDFKGVAVNADGLQIYKQKIIIDIELLSYNVQRARNLGLEPPSAITASLDGELLKYENVLPHGDSGGSGGSGGGSGGATASSGDSSSGEKLTVKLPLKIDGLQTTIRMLKQNQAAKKLYSTQLSTQSGEPAVFQSGGTMHKVFDANQNSTTTKEIDYGFLIKTTPIIIDPFTVNLDFELDHKVPRNEATQEEFDLERYQTKSKYIVRPGESIVLSGFKQTKDSMTKTGWPILSRIPFIGKILFGARNASLDDTDILLVVTINWALENDAAEAVRRRDDMRNRDVSTIEMP